MVIEITFFNQNFAENESDMKMFNTLLVVGIATALLVTGGTFIHKITLQIHPNSFLDGMAKYQLFALTVAVLATLTTLVLNPESKQFLDIGQLSTIAEKEKWLGISGKSSWTLNGLQLLFFVSIATGIFMFLARSEEHTSELQSRPHLVC